MKTLPSPKVYPLLLFLTLITLSAFSQGKQDSVLKVGYTGSHPFVIDNDTLKGISVDLWKEIAFQTHLDYGLQYYKNVSTGLKAIENREIDILVGPITINSERAAAVSLTHPFYETEMAILAPRADAGVWEYLLPFFSGTFWYAILILFLALTIVGTLLWLVERENLHHEKNRHLKGIGNGIWLAIVTMTTVGYGDYSPKTAAGRVILGIWMIISLITATSFVAGIASNFTINKGKNKTITSLLQMEGKRIAVPSNEEVINHVITVGGKPVPVLNVDEAYKKLTSGGVDALLYDAIPLQYTFNQHPNDDFILSKKHILPQLYGLAFPNTSPLKRKIDVQILKMNENNEVQKIIHEWLN